MLLKEGYCLKDHILDVCKLSDKSANHGFGATSLNTLIQMVRNLGTTLIPSMAKEQLIDGNEKLAAIALNEPSPHRRITFILRTNYTRLSSIELLNLLFIKRGSVHVLTNNHNPEWITFIGQDWITLTGH